MYSIILLYFMILGLVAAIPVKADVSGLSVAVGDHWTYNYSTLVATLNLTGTLKVTIIGAETINSHGTMVDVYNVTDEAGGYVTGGFVTGSWTLTGHEYHRRSDMATLAGTGTIHLQANGVTVDVVITSDPYPAQEQVNFPLYMGKTWTQTVTTKTDLTTTVRLPPPNLPMVTQRSITNTTTTTYAVIDTPVVNVEAGSFDSYKIQSSDKNSINYAYYSPQVNAPVKSISTNSTTGQVTTSTSLKEYSSWPYKTSYNLSGTSRLLVVQSDVSPSNFKQNASFVSFTMSGREGTTGHVTIIAPSQFNTTSLTVYVDNQAVASTISRTSDNYTISLILPHYSSHTVALSYAKPVVQAPSLLSSLLNYYYLILGAVAIVIIVVATVLVTRRRGRTGPPSAPSQQPPPPPASTPPLEPQPAESPASSSSLL